MERGRRPPRDARLSALRAPRIALCVALAAAAALAGCGGGGGEPPGQKVAVRVDRAHVVTRSRMRVGITHTEFSLDVPASRAAIARGRAVASRVAGVQNQHIYGWGASNPEPRPGVYDWRSLDRRVALMRSLPGTPVITLCCAPDWMTRLGRTGSTYPNLPPTAAHVADFARLATAVARRYPSIRHFIVWNELKGYYSRRLRNWDAAAYAQLYNATYDALKAVNPAIRVGGPYIVLAGTGSGHAAAHTTWATADPIIARDRRFLRRWLRLAHGVDFLAIDRSLVSPTHDPNRYPRSVLIGLTHWFGDVVRELSAMSPAPVWYAESYIHPESGGRFAQAAEASMLAQELRGGAAVSLRWGPQATGPSSERRNAEALWSDPRRPGGGRPLPLAAIYALFRATFPPGTPIVASRSSSPGVETLASTRTVLLINKLPRPVSVTLPGARVALPGYGVRVVPLGKGA